MLLCLSKTVGTLWNILGSIHYYFFQMKNWMHCVKWNDIWTELKVEWSVTWNDMGKNSPPPPSPPNPKVVNWMSSTFRQGWWTRRILCAKSRPNKLLSWQNCKPEKLPTHIKGLCKCYEFHALLRNSPSGMRLHWRFLREIRDSKCLWNNPWTVIVLLWLIISYRSEHKQPMTTLKADLAS